MLKIYVFNEFTKNWDEENTSILFHDLCAIFDEENHSIYLWNGPKSSKKKFNMGLKILESIIAKYPTQNYSISKFSKESPNHIKSALEDLLESVKKKDLGGNLKFTHFITIRIFIVIQIILLLIIISSLINIFSCLNWISSGENYIVNSSIYANWLTISLNLTILSLVLCVLILIIGFFESESQVIIFSSIGILITIGIILYLQQGIFIFLFQDGSTQDTYYILKSDVYIFLLLNSIAYSLFEIPNLIKLFIVFKKYKKFIF